MSREVDALVNSLAHYGTKGMKWGVRKKTPITFDSNNKISRRPTRSEILDARANRKETQKAIKKENANDVKDPKTGKIVLTAQQSKNYKQLMDSDAAAISVYKTRGEQVIAALLFGPVGAIAYSDARLGARAANRSLMGQ